MYLKDNKELLKLWDYEKNSLININNVKLGSNKSYYWKCPNCGNSWKRRIWRMVNENASCPKCAKEIKHIKYITNNGSIIDKKNLIKEWDYEKNNLIGIYPERETIYSSNKAYWICSKGHSYYSRIDGRVRGRGCPYCANKKVLKGFNDLLFLNPKICKEWDYGLNKLGPDCYTNNSNIKVHWICPKKHRC